MSKAKLTIENTELEKFKSCAELAGMRVLEVQNLGTLNQVLCYYKVEQQILMCGRYMEKIQDIQTVDYIEKAVVVRTKKKVKS